MVTVTIDNFFGYDAVATTLLFDDTTELVVEDVIESPTGEHIFVSEIPSSIEITAIRGWDSTTADILNDNDALTVVEEEVVDDGAALAVQDAVVSSVRESINTY